LGRNAGKTAEMHLNNPAQVEAEHQPGSGRKIRHLGLGDHTMTEISTKLDTPIQMRRAQVRHRDISGNYSPDSRAITTLYSDEFGSGLIGFGSMNRGNRH